MPKKTFTTEQIISKLSEAEVLIGQGQTIAAVSKVIEVTEQTSLQKRCSCQPLPRLRASVCPRDKHKKWHNEWRQVIAPFFGG